MVMKSLFISKKTFQEKSSQHEEYTGQTILMKASKSHMGAENVLVKIQLGKKQDIQSLIDLGIEFDACVYLNDQRNLVKGSWEDNWMGVPFPEENQCIEFRLP
jgi:hypothetical protein